MPEASVLLFGSFKESSEEGWLQVKLPNPILSLIPQLHFHIGDEIKPWGPREEALGSVSWGAAGSPVAEQPGKGGFAVILGAKGPCCLSDSSAILCSGPKWPSSCCGD